MSHKGWLYGGIKHSEGALWLIDQFQNVYYVMLMKMQITPTPVQWQGYCLRKIVSIVFNQIIDPIFLGAAILCRSNFLV